MVTTTQLRILRRRHHISPKELHHHSGFSGQYISQLELGRYSSTPRNEQALDHAFRAVIAARKAALEQLELEYEAHKGNLLQPLEVEADEL